MELRNRNVLLGLIGISLFVIYIIINDPISKFSSVGSDVSWNFIVFGIVISFSAYLVMSIRFWSLANFNERVFSVKESFQIHLLTPILGRITPGNVGEVYKISLTPNKSEGAFVHLMERIFDFSILLLASLSIFILFSPTDIIKTAIFSAFGLFLLSIFLLSKIDKIVNFFSVKLSQSEKMEDEWFKNTFYIVFKIKLVQIRFTNCFNLDIDKHHVLFSQRFVRIFTKNLGDRDYFVYYSLNKLDIDHSWWIWCERI